jgi:hypothetical protein
MIAYKEHPETASYTWEYRGGCYANGEIAVFEKAVSGEEYKFDNVPIEVREDESQYTAFNYQTVTGAEVDDSIADASTSKSYQSSSSSPAATTTSTSSGGGFSSFCKVIYILCLVGAIVCLILFLFFFFKAWKGA